MPNFLNTPHDRWIERQIHEYCDDEPEDDEETEENDETEDE